MSSRQTSDSRHPWERRAREQGESYASVLYRGLPEAVNAYIHDRHKAVISAQLLPRLEPGSRILDLGCGYGRTSRDIQTERPDLTLVGLDVSITFCRLFRANLAASSVCGDVATPPFAARAFDAITAITSFMYVPPAARARAMDAVIALLRPGGLALFLDPGREYMRWVAALRPSTTDTPTGGHWFSAAEYAALGNATGRAVVKRGGMPVFSLLLPGLLLVLRRPILFNRALRFITRADAKLARFSRYSIHRWMIVMRTA